MHRLHSIKKSCWATCPPSGGDFSEGKSCFLVYFFFVSSIGHAGLQVFSECLLNECWQKEEGGQGSVYRRWMEGTQGSPTPRIKWEVFAKLPLWAMNFNECKGKYDRSALSRLTFYPIKMESCGKRMQEAKNHLFPLIPVWSAILVWKVLDGWMLLSSLYPFL